MHKKKTHKSARKRLKVTKNGKVLYHRAGKRHLLSVKSGKRRRKLRKAATAHPKAMKTFKRLLGLMG